MESPHERDIYSVHVWGCLVHILQGWIQSIFKYLRRNALTTGDIVFSSTQCKQKYGTNSRLQISADVIEMFSEFEIEIL